MIRTTTTALLLAIASSSASAQDPVALHPPGVKVPRPVVTQPLPFPKWYVPRKLVQRPPPDQLIIVRVRGAKNAE